MVKLRSTWMMRRNFSILNIICIIEFQKRAGKKHVKLFAFFYTHIFTKSACERKATLFRDREAFQRVCVCVCAHDFIYLLHAMLVYTMASFLTSSKMNGSACSCNQMFFPNTYCLSPALCVYPSMMKNKAG